MKILFMNNNSFIRKELEEFIESMKGAAYFADSFEDAVLVLNSHSIDTLFLEVKSIMDMGLLKYANEHFKNIRIVLIADNRIEGAISAIKNGSFTLLAEPVGLRQVRYFLTDNNEGGIYNEFSTICC